MKANRTHQYPPKIERLSDKDSHYNFNISHSIIEQEEGGEHYDNYDYDQVTVTNPVTQEKIKQAVSQEYDLEDVEIEINNDCQALNVPDI